MKGYLITVVLAVGIIGAAATVSRQEFDELRGRVAILEGRFKRLENTVKTEAEKVGEALKAAADKISDVPHEGMMWGRIVAQAAVPANEAVRLLVEAPERILAMPPDKQKAWIEAVVGQRVEAAGRIYSRSGKSSPDGRIDVGVYRMFHEDEFGREHAITLYFQVGGFPSDAPINIPPGGAAYVAGAITSCKVTERAVLLYVTKPESAGVILKSGK